MVSSSIIKPTNLSFSSIGKQLKADLIGKDSYRGVTLTYSWLANQFGHFSLGFIPAIILRHLINCTEIVAAVTIWLTWFIFELWNFLGPLLLKRRSNCGKLFIPRKKKYKYTFQPPWGNIAFDTCTDLCFFLTGVVSAVLYLRVIDLRSTMLTIILLGLCFLVVIILSYCWFLIKMYIQGAQYPFQWRLSQWNFDISEDDKQTVNEFLKNKDLRKHLLVFGKIGSGKTSISVGIGTEMSIKHYTCIYATAIKIFSMFCERDKRETSSLWTWQNADVLIIDDINPDEEDFITPKAFLKYLDKNKANRRIIRDKKVIWVLGNKDKEKSYDEKWKNMLQEIGVSKENIVSILLPHPPKTMVEQKPQESFLDLQH